MNNLRALHARVNAPATVAVALEAEQIALEGFLDGVKAKWEAFKQTIKPTDHEEILNKLMMLPKMKQDLAKIKSQVSAAGDADIQKVAKRVNKAAGHLQVNANNPQQLLVEMEKARKTLEVLGRKVQQASTPEQFKAAREQFAAFKKRQGKVNPNMAWSKDEVLKFIDVLGHYFDTATVVGKSYMEAHAKAKREQPDAFKDENHKIVFEHLDELESIAMEGFFTVLAGLGLLWASILIYVVGLVTALWGMLMMLGGAFIPGLLAIAGGYAVMELGNAGRNSSDRMIYGDVYG